MVNEDRRTMCTGSSPTCFHLPIVLSSPFALLSPFRIDPGHPLIVVAQHDTIPAMKAKHRKTLRAVFARPTRANIRFTDIESLLVSLGGEIEEGAGSRMSVTISGRTVFLHRPHPGKEARKYQVENAREFLLTIGEEP